jgi:lysophospholipid acyltransferase
LVTQAAFSFTVTPFVLLKMSDSLAAWSRVYFYTVIGVLISMGFFASPGKQMLRKQLEARAATTQAGQRPGSARSVSQESLTGNGPVLGLSQDPEREVQEIMDEVRTEIERRQWAAGKAGVQVAS